MAEVTYDDLNLLYEKHFEKLYRFFYYKVLDQVTAEDLTADTFMAVAEAVNDYRPIDNLEGFLYGTARIVFVSFLQRKYKEAKVSLEGSGLEEIIAATEAQVEECETIEELLSRFLPHLPNKQQQVLKLRFIDKLSVKEASEHLGRDSNYVRTTQKRGLQSLRELIATQGFAEPDIKSDD